jgi:glycosyltransferase involved in cell wall biosynthesis
LMKCSVLLSVYDLEKPKYFDAALASLHAQTRQPDELVVVLDGPISQPLLSVLDKWESQFSFPTKRVPLPENRGLGVALQEGLSRCSYEIVARMDTDDINYPHRLEKQTHFLEQHPEVAAVSSWLACFESDPDEIHFVRKMSADYKVICKRAKYRNPVLHPAVVYRKSVVEAVGGYNGSRFAQDYHLWVRMILNGKKITSIQEPLCKFRYNNRFLNRRTSWRAIKELIKMQDDFVKMGFISRTRAIFNIGFRMVLFITPVRLAKFLRKKFIKL